TAAIMLSIMSGSLIRATPPCLRMSAGTRSSAMTATAPASSAILAWSAVTTSMMTPPLSISAIPRLTRTLPVTAALALPVTAALALPVTAALALPVTAALALPVTAATALPDGDAPAFSVGADSLDKGNRPLEATWWQELLPLVYVRHGIDRLGIAVDISTAPGVADREMRRRGVVYLEEGRWRDAPGQAQPAHQSIASNRQSRGDGVVGEPPGKQDLGGRGFELGQQPQAGGFLRECLGFVGVVERSPKRDGEAALDDLTIRVVARRRAGLMRGAGEQHTCGGV